MRLPARAALFLLALVLCGCLFSAPAEPALRIVNPVEYTGMADASGGAALTTNLFAVANDEDNRIRIYRADLPGPPVRAFDFNRFLQVRGKSLEADLEAAARIGDRIFWIGSHGRNRAGKERLNRCRFFATDLSFEKGEPILTPVGKPYTMVLEDLVREPRLAPFDLGTASRSTPKAPGALNIEGLAATPEGGLLIGFRNPIPRGQALLVPLVNPDAVVTGARAVLGGPILLDLGGRGVRDIAFYSGSYVIIAGASDGRKDFRIFLWKGPGSTPEAVKVKHLNRYHPEGLIFYPGKGLREFQVLSDDGTRPINGVPGKEIKDPGLKRFRSFWLRE